MSISGILESLATYYKERMFGQIHELTYNTENALFDGFSEKNYPPVHKAILESISLDLSKVDDDLQDSWYTIRYNRNHGTQDTITITFPNYGSQQEPKYDYHNGLANIQISGTEWSRIKIMAGSGSTYIVSEHNIPDPGKKPINHIIWQTGAGRAIPFLKSMDLVILILLESSMGSAPDIQLSFDIVEIDNPVNTEVSHINKPETTLSFPVLTMSSAHNSSLIGANPQYIPLPFNHPVLALIVQVSIPIKSAEFIPFPFNDKYKYKIPLELNKDSGCWEIVFQNPDAPIDELFRDKTTINFTKLANPEPVLVITPDSTEPFTDLDYKHSWSVNMWAIQRNICRIMSGMAGPAFMG